MYENFFIKLAAGSSSTVELHPTPDFSQAFTAQKKHGVTLGGQLNTYNVNTGYTSYTMPLTFVTSVDRLLIRSWWLNQNELFLTYNTSGTSPKIIAMRIGNIEEPLPQQEFANLSKYQGVLFLKQTRASGALSGGAFLLDDVYWGKLDQSYNVLT